jgi:hypothetical protein
MWLGCGLLNVVFLPGVEYCLYMSTLGHPLERAVDETQVIMEIREEVKKRFGYENILKIDYTGLHDPDKLRELVENFIKYSKCVACGRVVQPIQTEHIGLRVVAIAFECPCGTRLVIWCKK